MNHLDDYELQLKRRLTFISSSLVDSTSRLTQMSEVLIDTTFSVRYVLRHILTGLRLSFL